MGLAMRRIISASVGLFAFVVLCHPAVVLADSAADDIAALTEFLGKFRIELRFKAIDGAGEKVRLIEPRFSFNQKMSGSGRASRQNGPANIKVEWNIPWLGFARQPDGRLRVSFAPSQTMDVEISTRPDGGEPIDQVDPITVNIAINAPDLILTYRQLGDGPESGVEFSVSATRYDVVGRFAVPGSETGEPVEVRFGSKVSGLISEGFVSNNWNPDDINSWNSRTRSEISNYAMSLTHESFSASVETGHSESYADIAKGVLDTTSTLEDMQISVVLNDESLPISGPIEVAIDRLATSTKLHLQSLGGAAENQPKDQIYDVDIQGVQLSNNLWAFLDPLNILTREFNRLRYRFVAKLDNSPGQVQPDTEFDLRPANIGSMSIEPFLLDALGMVIKVDGHITAAKTGKAHISFTGIEDVADKLTRSGILPPYAMVVIVIIQQFAKPGSAPGELVIDLEATEDNIIINGQSIPLDGALNLPQ